MKSFQTLITLTLLTSTLIGCTEHQTLGQPATDEQQTISEKKQAQHANELNPASPLAFPTPVTEEMIAITEATSLTQAQRIQVTPRHRLSLQSPTSDIAPMPDTTAGFTPNSEYYAPADSNGVFQTATHPLSTFSIDVDTGSYSNVRQLLRMGQRPQRNAIREEAFINYFPYAANVPIERSQPFAINTEIAPAPWHDQRHLLRITIQGYDIPRSARKPANLVFLIDVSGSMSSPHKLPLITQSLSLLAKNLTAQDSLSIVTYAGQAATVLPSTQGDNSVAISAALARLTAGGSTAGESGIRLAYQQAKQGWKEEGLNRVILATDGDFNVGTTSIEALKKLIETERKQGISLTTLGVGRGNYNDALMEQLANIGNGNHAYIDSLHEAEKVLVRQMSGTLQSIAHDVKIQLEFNPATVKEYRLIGYQNRLLEHEDFNNDHVDAGEIGAGHTVTALYELTLSNHQGQIDDLKYQTTTSSPSHPDELAQIKVRYKLPGQTESRRIKSTLLAEQLTPRFSATSQDFQFSTAVAAFAQKLKGSQQLNHFSYQQISAIARDNRGDDPYNYRGEFVQLVELAKNL